MSAALQVGNDDSFHAFMRAFNWSTGVDEFHSLWFRQRDL
jgi:hypothetical protein